MSNIYLRFIYTSILLSLLVSFEGCNIINPAEKTPTYIRIDSFSFEGNQSHKITNVWVYYNNNPVGAFDLPATIPILASGNGSVQFAPGIPINGRNERPVAYPFYTIDTLSLADQPGKIIYHTPKTGYFDSAKINFISQFESGITKFSNKAGTTSLMAVNADSLVFNGSGTGAVYLNAVDDYSLDSTSAGFSINTGASFIEFDYKSTIPFELSMRASIGTLYAYKDITGVNPSSTWQKFYMNVTSTVSEYPGGTYHLFIKTKLLSGQTSGRLLIDNIKLVTF
ncbi:MAG: hypothetical protein K9G49_00400 [Taibaiella sp.]|nr:hypothetical protein [Taibaiella sp.]